MASMSPKHDTHPLVVVAGEFAVSILAGDQIGAGQYFSSPDRRFHHIAQEWTEVVDGRWLVVPECIAWLGCEVLERKQMFDHDLFFARVGDYGYGRLTEPPLPYSPRKGWRITGERARTPGRSIRDQLLERLRAAGYDVDPTVSDEPED